MTITLSLLISCIVPKIDVVTLRANLFSSEVYKNQPYINYYLDILTFAESIANSFKVSDSMAKGSMAKPLKKTGPEDSSSDRAIDSKLSLAIKLHGDINCAFSSVINSGVLKINSFFCLNPSGGGSPGLRVQNLPSRGMPFYPVLLVILFCVLPRGNLEANAYNLKYLYTANDIPATGKTAGFFICTGETI
jgi:hypothetical protein